MLTTTHNTLATPYIYSYCIVLTSCTEKPSGVAYYLWHESPSHPKGPHLFICNKSLWKQWGEIICRQIWQKLGRNAGNHFNDPLNSGLTENHSPHFVGFDINDVLHHPFGLELCFTHILWTIRVFKTWSRRIQRAIIMTSSHLHSIVSLSNS